MADNTKINQDTLGKLLADDIAPLQADVNAMLVEGYKNREGGDGKNPDSNAATVLSSIAGIVATTMHAEAQALQASGGLESLTSDQLTEKLLLASHAEMTRLMASTEAAEQAKKLPLSLAEAFAPGVASALTGVKEGAVDKTSAPYKALTGKLTPVEASEVSLKGAAGDDLLQDNLTDPFASTLVALEGRYGQLVERNKQTAEQEKVVVEARSSYLAALRGYQADPNKSPIVSENEQTINGYTKQIEDAAKSANSGRQDSILLISRVAPQIEEARAKIEDYLARKNAGETIPEDEITKIKTLLKSIPDNLDSLENKLSSLSQLANDAPNPARNLDKIVNPAPPVTEVSPAEDNFFYTAARDQFSTGASAGLIGLYTGMESDAGAKLRGALLQGLSNPELGKAALKSWPDGKLRYAAPGNPQGAIAAALEAAIQKEQNSKSDMRRTLEANVPFASNVYEEASATLGAFVARRGLDNVSGAIYQAGLEGFKEAGLDPAKKGQYTQEQLEAATKIIAAKVRTALSTDSNGNVIADSNDVAVIDQLTGVTSSARGFVFSNHYAMNLAGVYESLLTAEYGSDPAKAHFKTSTEQYLANEKAVAAKSGATLQGAGTTSLVGVYSTFLNNPASIDEMLRIVAEGGPDSTTKLAVLVGQGGKLAREMSRTLTEAGYSVNFSQAQTAIDQAIVPAIEKTLQNYGGHLTSGRTLSYDEIVDIASEAGLMASGTMATMGGIGDLSKPEIRNRIAGVYDNSDGSSLSVGSMTAALFAARSGDESTKLLIYRQAMRGAEDQGLPSNEDIADGLRDFFPDKLRSGGDPGTANKIITAAMIDARENAQADGIMRAFQRLWDAIQALICIMSSDQYSLSDFGTLMSMRDQQRFEQKYQGNLNGLTLDQLGGYTPDQVFRVSLDRVYENREGIDRAHSPALHFNDGTYRAGSGGGTVPINFPANLPGFDGQMIALYVDDGVNPLVVANAETQAGLPDGVKKVAREAANKGLVAVWQDKDGDTKIGSDEIYTMNQEAIKNRAAERGGIDI